MSRTPSSRVRANSRPVPGRRLPSRVARTGSAHTTIQTLLISHIVCAFRLKCSADWLISARDVTCCLNIWTLSQPTAQRSGAFVSSMVGFVSGIGYRGSDLLRRRRKATWWRSWSSKPWWGSTKSQVGSIPIRLRHLQMRNAECGMQNEERGVRSALSESSAFRRQPFAFDLA